MNNWNQFLTAQGARPVATDGAPDSTAPIAAAPIADFGQTLTVPQLQAGFVAAITDQGEGSDTAITRYRRRLQAQLMAVKPDYREDLEALKVDYPSYTNDGQKAESRDAHARHDSAAFDHYERFGKVKDMLPVKTWPQWHREGHRWTEKMLTNERYNPLTAPKNIPA
ncbi:hypothetical protein, partial [Pseudomonas aeruginosa]|uniref:hypothetical protein n=1 Tax=Pseudomonas aeruginosa TaxID=287 RepID=UPI003896D690